MFCPECGYENNDKNKFCMGCGKLFEQGESEAKKHSSPNTPLSEPVAGNVKTKLLNNQRIIIFATAILLAVLIAVGVIFFVIPQVSRNNTNKFKGRIASGSMYTIVLNDDGTVNSYLMEDVMKNANKHILRPFIGFGQCDVSEWKEITAVSVTSINTLGLKKDGTVVATGDNWIKDEVVKWKDIAIISSSSSSDYGDVAGLKKDGTVITTNEELDVSGWKNMVDISMGNHCIAGLKKDGTVVCTLDSSCQLGDQQELTNVISEWKNIIDIEILDGEDGLACPSVIALKKDGTVATAFCDYNDYDRNWDWVSSDDFSDWKDITSVSCTLSRYGRTVVGLKKDGTVVTNYDEFDVSDWKDIAAVSASKHYIAGLKKDGTLVSTATLIEYDKSAVDEIINSESDDKSENTADSEIQTEAVTEVVTEAIMEKIADFDSIIPEIHTGITEDEMLDIMGYGYDSLITPFDNIYPDSRTDYEYIVDSIPVLGCNMPAVMFFEFNEQGKLFNFGYHIGFDSITYYYGETELVNEYDRIYKLLENSNVFWSNIMSSSYSDNGIKKAYSGSLVDSAEKLWFIVGTDMWNNSGINEITMSCEDETLSPLY